MNYLEKLGSLENKYPFTLSRSMMVEIVDVIERSYTERRSNVF